MYYISRSYVHESYRKNEPSSSQLRQLVPECGYLASAVNQATPHEKINSVSFTVGNTFSMNWFDILYCNMNCNLCEYDHGS